MEHLVKAPGFTLDSRGAGGLHVRVVSPEGAPKAALVIIHGILEHSGRYQEAAEYFADRGVLVAIPDLMGHGESISAACPQGCFVGGWDAAVVDCLAVLHLVQREYPELPCFLLGHSMGSFLVRTMLFSGAKPAGAVLSGTGRQPGAMLEAGLAAAKLEMKRNGRNSVSKTLNSMAFGGYAKAVKKPKTAYDWISSDEAEVQRYIDDPLCGFDASTGLLYDMLGGIKGIQEKKNLRKMTRSLPVLFVAGLEDPVGDMGEGVLGTAAAFRSAGMENVRVSLYAGRHELFHEAVRFEVFEELLRFMGA